MNRIKQLTMTAPRAAAVKLSVSTSSAQSAALAAGDHVFVCDQPCHILFGSSPVATISCPRIPANAMVRISGVKAGEVVAVIADDAGSAFIWPDT